MSEFNETKIKDFLRHYGLYNLTSHYTLQGGMDNVNIHVCTPGGDFVIRQYRHTNLQDIYFELETIAFLNEHRFPTPQIYTTISGEPLIEWQGYPTTLFTFVHGRRLTVMTPQLTRDAGRTLAQYHKLVHGFSPKHKKARHDFTIFERFAQAEEQIRLHCENAELLISDFRVFKEQTLAEIEAIYPQLPKGVLHGDFHIANLLYDDHDNIISLLDFDCSFEGALLFDTVEALLYWGFKASSDKPDVDMARIFLTAYDAERKITPLESEYAYRYLLSNCLSGACGHILGALECYGEYDALHCNMYQLYRRFVRSDGLGFKGVF